VKGARSAGAPRRDWGRQEIPKSSTLKQGEPLGRGIGKRTGQLPATASLARRSFVSDRASDGVSERRTER
jgi:hypothetical protein